MANAVVPDGYEVDEHPPRMPRAGLVVALAVGAVVALMVASGGGSLPASVPDDTLPDLELVMGDVWERVQLPGSAPLTAVAATGDGGYLAVGAGPQFWWSSNGLSWILGRSRLGEATHVSDVAMFDGGAVAVGSDRSGSTSIPTVWNSILDRTFSAHNVAVAESAGFDGVVADGDRLVAWGWTGTPEDFAPGVGPLLMMSDDGIEWAPIGEIPAGTRIHRATAVDGVWYVMGSLIGQPVLWRSEDLRAWDLIPTGGLRFGWAMVDLFESDGSLIANLLDLGLHRTEQWRLGEDGGWELLGAETQAGPVTLVGEVDVLQGVGSGRLWTREEERTREEEWSDAGLDGEVSDVAGDVAVGSVAGQPVVWVRGAEAEPVITVAPAAGPTWDVVTDLGVGDPRGPWLVAGGWVVGVGTDWWLARGDSVVAVPDLAGTELRRIEPVGGEWVALPTMSWSSNGLDWEARGQPWPGAVTGENGSVVSVTGIGGLIWAVGFNEDRLWTVATSADLGKTWALVGSPAPSTPIRDIRAVPEGFVGVAARPRNTEELVKSVDGAVWETLGEAEFIELAEPPAVQTPDGAVMTLSSDRPLGFTQGTVTALAVGPDGTTAVVVEDTLWTGAELAEEVPLDPRHGLSSADVRPMPVGGDLLVLAFDRGRVRIHRWTG